MNLEIKEIIKNLKLANKNNLDKIYLEITSDKKTEIINLESGEKAKNSEISKSNLLIKMNMNTLLELKENKKIQKIYYLKKKLKFLETLNYFNKLKRRHSRLFK